MTAVPRVLVFGNACTDRIYHVQTLPRRGETLLATCVSYDLGGKGLNQAVAAGRSGADVLFVGPVGNDAAATEIRDLLRRENLSPSGLLEHDGATDNSLILVDAKGENMIVSDTRLITHMNAEAVSAAIVAIRPDVVLLQGNASFEATSTVVATARDAGARVVLNPAPFEPRIKGLANAIDVVILNAVELGSWTGLTDVREAVCQTGCGITVVTLGSHGCILSIEGLPLREIAAPRVESLDTVGAGDVFVGVFLGEWLCRGDAAAAALLAVHAASDKVTRCGTISAFPTRKAIATMRENLGLAS